MPVTLDDLIAQIRAQRPDREPLTDLADAVVLAQRLSDHADHLVGYFVDQARRAGASWADIGRSMGVSKQAAQQRFVPNIDGRSLDERFADGVRTATAAANDEARVMKNAEVGTEHLLLGILLAPGLGAQALDAAGVAFEDVRAAAVAAGAPTVAAPPKQLPFSALANKALQVASREALRLGDVQVGTEHLLLAILDEGDGIGSAVLRGLGVEAGKTRAWIAEATAK